MAGVVNDGDIGIAGAVGEITQRAAGLGRAQIMPGIHHVEAGPFQGRRDGGAVVHGVGELRHVLIGGIADHQRDALLGKGRLTQQEQGRGEEELIEFRASEEIGHGDTEQVISWHPV